MPFMAIWSWLRLKPINLTKLSFGRNSIQWDKPDLHATQLHLHQFSCNQALDHCLKASPPAIKGPAFSGAWTMSPPWKNWLSHWSDRTITPFFMSSGQDSGINSVKRGTIPWNEYYVNRWEAQHFLQGKYSPGLATTGCPAMEFHYLAFILRRFIWKVVSLQAFFIHNAEKYTSQCLLLWFFLQNLHFLGIHTCI